MFSIACRTWPTTWGSDQSLGNFFLLTCPRLWDLETVTYFGIYRDRHSAYALEPIRGTTQFMLDVFRLEGRLYIRPVKVQHRSRDVMNTLHLRSGESFLPVKESAVLAPILSHTQWPRLQSDRRVGYWRRLFRDAEAVAEECRENRCPPERREEMLRRVRWALRVHRSGIAPLVERYLTLEDFLAIRDRMIGIGSVGGKTLGMLVARAILREQDPDLSSRLEAHDSFFVGAEVFITFLVQNDVWWLREQQKKPEHISQRGWRRGANASWKATSRERSWSSSRACWITSANRPTSCAPARFWRTRAGNAFSGKYESVFVANRGSREKRKQALLDAVRRVYASVLDEEALAVSQTAGLAGERGAHGLADHAGLRGAARALLLSAGRGGRAFL